MTAKLQITAIIPYPVWVGTRNQMLVKVETDQGVFGWGESGLSGREKAVAGSRIKTNGVERPLQLGEMTVDVADHQVAPGGVAGEVLNHCVPCCC